MAGGWGRRRVRHLTRVCHPAESSGPRGNGEGTQRVAHRGALAPPRGGLSEEPHNRTDFLLLCADWLRCAPALL